MQRLECLGENIARAIGGATGQAILKSGQAGTIAKRIEERSKAEEAYMLENPEGCRKCLGTGILSETPEVIL